MEISSGWRVLIAALALMPGVEAAQSQSGVRRAAERRDTAAPTRLASVFRGSTPCDASVRRLLDIPPTADAHLMEWTLTLDEPRSPGGSAHYHLTVRYGVTAAGRPGLAPRPATLERQGTWTSTKTGSASSTRVVYALSGAVALASITDDILHLLNTDGSLMVGNGGWSYTLTRDESAEQRLDPLLATAASESRTVSPPARGPSVYGIFEGRTPCQGIARQLTLTPPAGCAKVKWRITLFQNPDTRKPTRYKIESGLFRAGAREGEWTIQRAASADSNAFVYRLNPAADERALFLLRGDENVLFFLDDQLRPLRGHWEFSYTLNRRPD